jgi:hypothetical protein
LKASLVQEGLEKNARRDYEYSAKKKLYESYEPLLFQLSELSDMAFSRIEGIAKNAKEGTRLDNQIWQQFDSHYFRTTIYNVFAPLAIFKLIQKKLTFADFRIEEGIFLQYSLIKTLFYSFADDFKIARMRDLPEDKVYFARWNNQHKVFDPTFERQGLQSNKIDVIANAFLVADDKDIRLRTFAEFEAGLESDNGFNEKIKEAFALFKGFHPDTKPILWSILLVHACIHSMLIKVNYHQNFDRAMLDRHIDSFFKNNPDITWTDEDKGILSQTFETARGYLHRTLDKKMKR